MGLTAEQLEEARSKIAQYVSVHHEDTEGTKQDFYDALLGIDGYLDDNAASINQSIPEGPRAILTQKEKALILEYIAKKRAEIL